MRRRLGVWVLPAAVAGAVACGGAPALAPVPEPNLDDLKPEVRESLREARAQVEHLAAGSGGSATSAELAKAYRELGQRYQVHDLLRAAEACYRNVLTLGADDFETTYYLGVVLHQDGRLDEVTMLSAPYRAQVATLVLMPLLGLALAWWAQALFAARPAGRRSAQSPSPDLARSSRRNESSLAAPAGPA